jgi:DNA-binding transcriptional MerR regulator
MKIGELASRSGVAPSAIRFYEASGLLPAATRGTNGYRVYEDAALQKLLVIKLAQRLGFPLESLRTVLDQPKGMPHEVILARIRERLDEIEAMQANLRAQGRELRALMTRLGREWAEGRCLTLDQGATEAAGAPAPAASPRQPRRRGARAV